ncbi:MAG: hypothetical protein U0J08_06160, partial [Agathobaculum butyriciproducens]|nr:hypothetical protein [Agathobaculum butyriciproducens]
VFPRQSRVVQQRGIVEQILRPDEARVCSNTLCIAKSRNEIRAQNFRQAPPMQPRGTAYQNYVRR